jgi:hypothetical protein
MELNGKYFLSDIESGQWYQVSKEEHDAHLAFVKSMADEAIKHGYKGQIYLAGTFNKHEDSFDNFEKLWKDEKK